MKKIFFILLILPIFTFSQKKDYKSYDKAVIFFNNGETEKAKRYTNKCIQRNSDWEDPYQLLGKIYEEEGDIEQAVENYYQGFDTNNSEDQLWWQRLGDLYFKNGFYKKALYHYKSFIAFNDKGEANAVEAHHGTINTTTKQTNKNDGRQPSTLDYFLAHVSQVPADSNFAYSAATFTMTSKNI